MVDTAFNKEFLRWEVKPVWTVTFPSSLTNMPEGTFKIFGVDRGSLDIVRNWEKIQSVEQFNQGFVAKPMDLTFTIAVKESGEGYERLRRLAIGGVLFDVTCGLILETDNAIWGDRPEETGVPESTELDENGDPVLDENDKPITIPATPAVIPWMDGFEKYQACLVQREGQTVELATFPVREFECEFLRHQIMSTGSGGNFNNSIALIEGDGTYPHLVNLSI